jgi:uncharacterized membrane protein
MSNNKKNKKHQQSSASQSDLRARKKEAVLGNEKKKGGLMPIIMAVVLVAAIAGGYGLYTYRSTPAPLASSAPTVSATAVATAGNAVAAPGLVSYPVSLFDDGQAKHFDFQDGDKKIRYFVIKSADGVVRAAFDACDVCWPAGKGYYQEGDVMVCRNCGRKFASNLVNEVQGGCNPAPLKRTVENGMLVIHPDDIRSGAGYFNFKGKV